MLYSSFAILASPWFTKQGQCGEAERLTARALLILANSVGIDHPDVAVSLKINAALLLAQVNVSLMSQ